MPNFKVDCRKFQPNMFNKDKCSHCFKPREEHSSEALESNRVTRKVSKCGYLFVAPDWDFTIPLYRSKRWQRRWFVLYDDGELTYSVDDLPATIPQGTVDMNRVLEVSDAEDITGNEFALAITSLDRATFVKGTCREESKWWKDVLSVFPKQHGRHKRNATFPGIKASSNILQQTRTSFSRTPSPALAQSFDSSGPTRPRFLSCTTSILDTGRPSSAPSFESPDDEVFPLGHPVTSTPISSSTPFARTTREDHKENTPPYIQDYTDHPPTSESPPTQDKLPCHRPRTRRMAKREARGLTEARNEFSRKLILSDLEDCKREEKLKDIADSITRPRSSLKKSYTKEKPTREKDVTNSSLNKEATSIDRLTITEQVRGDPDGLEGTPLTFTSNADVQRVDLPAEDILHLKKGWLMKQGIGQEWNKYWFVLQGSALSFYRDPNSEDNGIMDGIVDLGMAKNIEECEVARNYGFKITMWEDKTMIFSAVAQGIRTNWVKALRSAASIPDVKSCPSNSNDKVDIKVAQQNNMNNSKTEKSRLNSIDQVDTSRQSIFSDDDEFRSASETFFHNSSSSPIGSSYAPASRSRGRSQSKERLKNDVRSNSSPPSSRRCTRDDLPALADQTSSNSESLQSFNDLSNRDSSEKASNGTLASCGETALVDLLETQVESLKSKLEQTQAGYMELRKENTGLRTQLTTVERESVASFYGLTTVSQLSLSGEDILIEETEELQRRIIDQERELTEKRSLIDKLEQLDKQFKKERSDMQNKLREKDKKLKDLSEGLQQREESVQNLHRMLLESEDKIESLNREVKNFNNEEINKLRAENIEATKQKSGFLSQLASVKEDLAKETAEVQKWKSLVQELKSMVESRNLDIERKRKEGESLRENLRSTQQELDQTSDRLYRGIEENESLCTKIRELERNLSAEKYNQGRRSSSTLSISGMKDRASSKRNLPRPNSLSDLTNFDLGLDPETLDKEGLIEEFIDLRGRFETAVNEVLAMKREMRDMQRQQDDLQLLNQRYELEIKANEDNYNSQLNLMSERVMDLTNKLTASEKQGRLLKQKLVKAENKEKKRSHSLKGKESFSLSRDIESKLQQLEARVEAVFKEEASLPSPSIESLPTESKVTKRSQSFDDSTKSSRLRRKSLDGSVNENAIKTILRMSELDAKMDSITKDEEVKVGTSSTNSSSTNLSTVNNVQIVSSSQNLSSPGSPLRSPLRSPSAYRKSLRTTRSTTDKQIKISRSESDVKILRDKISFLEKILNSLQSKLNECNIWMNSVEASCSCGKPSTQRLQYHLQSCLKLLQSRLGPKDPSAVERVRPLSQRIYDLLKEKVVHLSQKRQQLRSSGKWNRDAQLKLFAERLAFETVLLSQLGQIANASRKTDSYESSAKLQELIEAHRKLSFLEKKLSQSEFDMEPLTPLDFYTSLLAEKLVVEGDLMNQLMTAKPSNSACSETCKDLQRKLVDRERKMASTITQFKEEKLYEIAVVMARETVMGLQPEMDENILLEELRLREAWVIAQDLVTQELVNIEASQSMLRLSHLLTPDNGPSIVTEMNAVTLDKLQAGTEDSLRQEMEESVFTLSNKYEEVLSKYRKGDVEVIHSVSSGLTELLEEFAAVIAQKSLLDGQLVVATGDESPASDTLAIEETSDTVNAATDVVASESHLLMFLSGGDKSVEKLVQTSLNQAEFTFLYNKLSNQSIAELTELVMPSPESLVRLGSARSLNSSASDREEHSLQSVGENSCAKIPPSPRRDHSRKARRVSDVTGMREKCRQCDELRQEIGKLRRSLELRRPKKTEKECTKCKEHISKIKVLEETQRETIKSLSVNAPDTSKFDAPTRDTDDELTELKRRLCLLEEGYEAQISVLKQQYENNLGSQSDVSEESVRERYQIEIKHLRELCEKGLAAMESSHKRVIIDLQEKHRQELEALQTEKEEALAEETQATLAALDAMRKAHEAEVQKEINKFKEEHLKQGTGSTKRAPQDDIGAVRSEIIELSEKYSVKCLQAATLEDRIESLGKQLSDARIHVADLEARNRQMKSKLSQQASVLWNAASENPRAEIEARHTELVLKEEEIASLKLQLKKLQTLKASNSDKNAQLTQNSNYNKERGFEDSQFFQTIEPSRSCASLNTLINKDIRRSSSFSASSHCLLEPNSQYMSSDGLPSPFSGFVASRKKVFETSSLRAKKTDFSTRKLFFQATSTEC